MPVNIINSELIAYYKEAKKGVKICCNYRGINKVLLKNQYLLPLIRKILDAIYGVKLFIKLNIIAIFNKVKIMLGYK